MRTARLAIAFLVLVACGGEGEHPAYVAPVVPETGIDASESEDASEDGWTPPDGSIVDAKPDAPRPDADAADTRDAADAAEAGEAGPTTLHVLFIGNSYTYTNDLPGVLHTLSLSAGAPPTIEVESVTAGGALLQTHWEGTAAQPAITKGGHDFVVLQGQSYEPLGWPAGFETYAQDFIALSKTSGATPVMFETWARKAGCADYASIPELGGTPTVMQDGLSAEYVKVATTGGAWLAPVGEAYRAVWTNYPSIELYIGDGSHPSPAGTYLAACVFNDLLTGKTFASSTPAPSGISATDATNLRAVARDAVTKFGMR